MKTFDEIEHAMTNLKEQDEPSSDEVKSLLIALNELILDDDEWSKLDSASKNTANEWQAELKSLMKASSPPKASQQPKEEQAGRSERKKKKPDLMDAEEPHPPSHNPDAEELMEQAEKAFYSGRYQDAIRYYDQVLRLEPDWERAKEHRAQADEYMTKGHIPETMLPAEVASLYGKAQSAARVMRLKDAMTLYQSAMDILRENGITRWNEGFQFEKNLQSAIDAEEVAREAEGMFVQGRVDEAIERVNMAIDLTGYPKYKNALERYQKFNEEVKGLHEILFSGIVTLDPMLEASKRLTAMSAQYRGNQALATLQTRFNALKPILAEKMRQEVREIKSRF
jgi:tetratricopeptide (TPR) repeat protein